MITFMVVIITMVVLIFALLPIGLPFIGQAGAGVAAIIYAIYFCVHTENMRQRYRDLRSEICSQAK